MVGTATAGSTPDDNPAGDNPAGDSAAGDVAADNEGRDPLRDRLLDAAAEVFAESGYEGARVHQIAERAGLTTGAIYNRFTGKTELLLSALDRHSEPLLDVLVEADLPTSDVLAALAADLLNEKERPRAALLFEALLSARRESELAERLRPVLAYERERIANVVRNDQADGRIDPDLDVRSIVTFCQAAGLGMGLLRLIEAELPDAAEWQTLIARLIASVETPIGPEPSPDPDPPQDTRHT